MLGQPAAQQYCMNSFGYKWWCWCWRQQLACGSYLSAILSLLNMTSRVFSKTWLPPVLQQVLSCKSPAVFLHFPLEEKGSQGPFYQLSGGAGKRETPTSNFTESTGLVLYHSSNELYKTVSNVFFSYFVFYSFTYHECQEIITWSMCKCVIVSQLLSHSWNASSGQGHQQIPPQDLASNWWSLLRRSFFIAKCPC